MDNLLNHSFLKLKLLILPLICIATLQGPAYAGATNSDDYQAMVDQMKKLVPKYKNEPYEHEAAHKLFNINAYFAVLDRIKTRDIFQLDYIYCALPGYGRPYIYKREKNSAPFDIRTACSIMDDLKFKPDAMEQIATSYMRAVDVDGSPASLIQFAILYLIGDQFFLFDHAGYHDDVVIFTKSKMGQVMNSKLPFGKESLPDKVKADAKKIDVTPIFEESKEHDMKHITVRVVTFSLWKGFQRRSFVFNKELRYFLVRTTTETLVPYDIGARF